MKSALYRTVTHQEYGITQHARSARCSPQNTSGPENVSEETPLPLHMRNPSAQKIHNPSSGHGVSYFRQSSLFH